MRHQYSCLPRRSLRYRRACSINVGGRVAQVMDAKMWQARTPDDRVKSAANSTAVDCFAKGTGKHEVLGHDSPDRLVDGPRSGLRRYASIVTVSPHPLRSMISGLAPGARRRMGTAPLALES